VVVFIGLMTILALKFRPETAQGRAETVVFVEASTKYVTTSTKRMVESG
jgi:hypothetical protein